MSDFDPRPVRPPFDFRPWPPGDPVPWQMLDLDRVRILEVSKLQLTLHTELLQAQLKAAEGMQKILSQG